MLPLPKYAFMAWCSVKSTGATLPLPFYVILCPKFEFLTVVYIQVEVFWIATPWMYKVLYNTTWRRLKYML
jgi:hypothetical protein